MSPGAAWDTSLLVLAGPGPPTPHFIFMRIPAERITRLECLAAEAVDASDEDRSREYVRLARRIAERNRLRFPRHFERFSCDRCDSYLRPGKNARVRLQDGHTVITCSCGEQARYPYRP